MALFRFERRCFLDRIRGFGIAWVRRRALKAGLALILVFAAAFIALPMALDIRRQAEMRKSSGDRSNYGYTSCPQTFDWSHRRDSVFMVEFIRLPNPPPRLQS
jgi:hypothetical protein